MEAAFRAVGDELDAVKADVGNTAEGLTDLRLAVVELGRATRESVDGLRQELAGVTDLLWQQQATLAKMVEAQSSAQAARASYEKLVEERRARIASAGDGGGDSVRPEPPTRIEKTLQNGHHDPESQPAPALSQGDERSR